MMPTQGSTKESITVGACLQSTDERSPLSTFEVRYVRATEAAMSLFAVSVSMLQRESVPLSVATYAQPRAKMALSASFVFREVWSCQIIGMGNKSKAVLRTVLMTARAVREVMKSMQYPWGISEKIPPSDLQTKSIGQHWKTVVKNPAMAQPVWRAASVYRLHLKVRLKVVKHRL